MLHKQLRSPLTIYDIPSPTLTLPFDASEQPSFVFLMFYDNADFTYLKQSLECLGRRDLIMPRL